ncbi:Uncharacterised protein [Mycobacteroides abscessus subsp. abscessus]|nr:Uncharacterised protein [Mycobacteroides abscessus subsp. abscessus]
MSAVDLWESAAPFRVEARRVLAATGLHWRLYAAHLGVSPASIHRLLTGDQTRILRPLARAIAAVDVDDILAAESKRVPATETKRLLAALAALGLDPEHLAQWLTDGDLEVGRSRALYCTRATAVRVQACYDYLTHRRGDRREQLPRAPYAALDRKEAC